MTFDTIEEFNDFVQSVARQRNEAQAAGEDLDARQANDWGVDDEMLTEWLTHDAMDTVMTHADEVDILSSKATPTVVISLPLLCGFLMTHTRYGLALGAALQTRMENQ